MTLDPGQRLGPYEIVAPLGAGGMGEVYRARDARLGRDVAIKVLPREVSADAERLRRFEQEARAVAALSHPHVVVVHDIGVGDPAYIVLELVPGQSLRERLRPGPLPPARAAAIVAQVASALAAAHGHGVVHRDLKPDNVVLDERGTAKVLDFGIARVGATTPLAEAPTAIEATAEGTLLGTPGYMAPEQVRGELAGPPADLFALGAIWFEMLTAARAFPGHNAVEALHATLHAEPDWALLPASAAAWEPHLRRCLEKAPAERFQSAADLAWELGRPTAKQPAASPQRTSRRAVAAAAAALLAAAALAVGWWAGRRAPSAGPPTFDRMTRLVSSAAHESGPILSPDGKWVAYLSNARGPTDVWVKFIAGGDPVNLTASADLRVQSQDYIGSLAVSPDGSQIAFQATQDPSGRGGGTWVIPAPLGGAPRLLLPSPRAGMQWSPDGQRVAYIKAGGPLGDSVFVAEADGQNEVEIVKRQGARHAHWIRWDAAGKHVYFNYGFQNVNAETTEIFRAPVVPGPIERVVATTRRAISPFPSPDGRGLFFAANPDGVDLALWWRDLASGRDFRVTTGVGEFNSPTMSADGLRLVGTVQDVRESLVRGAVAFDRPVALEPWTDGFSGDIDPVFSPDGSRLVFSSSRAGQRTLWTARGDLTQLTQLTSGSAIDSRPAISPDGREVAFVSDRGGQRGIWLVSAQAGTPRKVVAADVLDTLTWSPDGRRLVFAAPVGDAPGLMTVDVASGQVTRVPTPGAAAGPSWSPREDLIAYIEPRGGGPGGGAYLKFVRSNGDTAPEFAVPEDVSFSNGMMAWSPDGTRLAIEQQSGVFSGAFWIVEPGTPQPYRKLVDLPAGSRVRGITWSRDGSSLIVGRVQRSGDIFLAERSARR